MTDHTSLRLWSLIAERRYRDRAEVRQQLIRVLPPLPLAMAKSRERTDAELERRKRIPLRKRK
jgi:hypothetical protein